MTPHQIIIGLDAGRFQRMEKTNPAGSLEVRKERDGTARFYWRGAVGKRTVRVAIGTYDSRASPKSLKPTERGFSYEAAKRAAEQVAQDHVANRDDGGYQAIREAKREQVRRAAQAKQEAAENTLEKLLTAYCDRLEFLGRNAHKDARSIFANHVIAAFPKLAKKPAAEITPEEIADMMRLLLEKGRGRTANKLRSYVRAAYETAKEARLDASIPVAFKKFGITSNPAAETKPDRRQNRADKNPLTGEELLTYWEIIKALPGHHGAALRLHLLTGGQRIAQLVALRTADVSGSTITLYDGKGRPGTEPRAHVLPLIPAAKKALDDLSPAKDFAISTDGGETHIHATTLLKWAQEAVGEAIPGFTSKRVRSGVETLLSQYGISKDVRGRLQSHGIAGVQDRHYDGHDFMPEKKRALLALYAALQRKKAGVTPIRSTAA